VLVNSAIWAIVLLIAASLWADSIDQLRKEAAKFNRKLNGAFYASVVSTVTTTTATTINMKSIVSVNAV